MVTYYLVTTRVKQNQFSSKGDTKITKFTTIVQKPKITSVLSSSFNNAKKKIANREHSTA